MKTILSLLLIATITTLQFVSCSNGNEKKEQKLADKKLGKIELNIPASLKDKPEILNYVQEMVSLSDEYALLIDEAAEKAAPFKGKKAEDLGMADKIKLTQITSELSFKAIEIIGKWGEYTDKRLSLEKELTEDEAKALESVMHYFEKRMEQIEVKHADLFGEEEEL